MPAWQNEANYNLYKVNLTRRAKPIVHKRGPSDTVDYFVGDNGMVLARERYDNESNIHRLKAWQDNEWVVKEGKTDPKRVCIVG